MFTGIISDMGSVATAVKSGGQVKLTIDSEKTAGVLQVGDSVSINGACQTVVRRNERDFTVEAVEETLRKTTLGELHQGSPVNLELPLRLGDRLGGHIVLGHVDGVGSIIGIEMKESSRLLRIEFPSRFERYVIPIGSIAVDGISLTVAALEENTATVSIIPHTLEATTLGKAKVGMDVNLEFDVLGKYIERMVLPNRQAGTDEVITWEKLAGWGYNQ